MASILPTSFYNPLIEAAKKRNPSAGTTTNKQPTLAEALSVLRYQREEERYKEAKARNEKTDKRLDRQEERAEENLRMKKESQKQSLASHSMTAARFAREQEKYAYELANREKEEEAFQLRLQNAKSTAEVNVAQKARMRNAEQTRVLNEIYKQPNAMLTKAVYRKLLVSNHLVDVSVNTSGADMEATDTYFVGDEPPLVSTKSKFEPKDFEIQQMPFGKWFSGLAGAGGIDSAQQLGIVQDVASFVSARINAATLAGRQPASVQELVEEATRITDADKKKNILSPYFLDADASFLTGGSTASFYKPSIESIDTEYTGKIASENIEIPKEDLNIIQSNIDRLDFSKIPTDTFSNWSPENTSENKLFSYVRKMEQQGAIEKKKVASSSKIPDDVPVEFAPKKDETSDEPYSVSATRKLAFGFEKAQSDVQNAETLLSAKYPILATEISITPGYFKQYGLIATAEEKFGEDYASLSVNERRKRINQVRGEHLNKKYADVIEAGEADSGCLRLSVNHIRLLQV